MTEIIEEVGGEFGLTVRYTVNGVAVDFFAAQIDGRDEAGVAWYSRKGASSGLDDTDDFNESERYVAGTVKWDGCSHFYFGDENGYLHICGASDVKTLSEVLPVIYERCGELMKAEGVNLLEDEFEAECRQKIIDAFESIPGLSRVTE